MRIAQVGSSLSDWGGIERYIWYLQTALRDRNHQVTVIAPPESRLIEMTQGVPLKLAGKHAFSQLPAYVRLLRSQPFDVVHAHYSPDFVVPGIAARLAKVPTRVVTRHLANVWSNGKARLYANLWPNMIAVSDAVRSTLIQSGVSEHQVVTAYAGIPEFPRTPARANRRDKFEAGFFGRLVPEKGVDVLLQAAVNAPDVRLHIFGDGPSEKELKGLATSLGLGDRVVWYGRVPDVEGYVESMDVIVIPSIWAEPFPYSGLEAMAMGKAVIASNAGGLPEMIRDGTDGWIVAPSDPAALGGALTFASQNYVETLLRGENGRVRQQTEFTLPKFGERIEAAYLRFQN